MIGIVIASHGSLAEGLLQSSQMMFGEQEDIQVVSLMTGDGPEQFKANLLDAFDRFDEDQQVLFLCDLWGGTPFNQASTIHEENPERTAIITGVNLPILLEALGGRMSMDSLDELVPHLLSEDVSGVNALPESIQPEESRQSTVQADQVVSGQTADEILPPGTVLGDGKIEYGLVRVDSRLLHGQVSTNWAKRVNPDRILVVSDEVAHDDMRKGLIQQAAPSGVKAHSIPLSKLVEIDQDPRFGDTKVLLLFENPQDVLKVMDDGVKFESVNLGSMAHSEGKTMLTNALSVDRKDIETLEKIREKGAKLDIRKVPADSPENFDSLLKKADIK